MTEKLLKQLEKLEIRNIDSKGNIIPLIGSALANDEGVVELVLYKLETTEPILKFQLVSLGCNPKLLELLNQTIKLYNQQEAERKREKVFESVRNKFKNETFVISNKEGSC